MSQHDLVIRSGSVIDGTGEPAFSADVAIKDDKIAEVGKVAGRGVQEVSADGALVTPGFVDIHTHYDGKLPGPIACRHQVTTASLPWSWATAGGFCAGATYDHDLLIELMEGVEDIPGVALSEGLSWEWESFPDYLDYLSKRQVRYGYWRSATSCALRVYVMGQRGAIVSRRRQKMWSKCAD